MSGHFELRTSELDYLLCGWTFWESLLIVNSDTRAMSTGSQHPTRETSSSDLSSALSFGVSSKFLPSLSSLPVQQPSTVTQDMSGLPLSSQPTFNSATSPTPTLMDGNPSIDLSGSSLSGVPVNVSATDEFKQNVSLVINTFIPRVQELTRSILHDLSRSYEPDTPQAQIAANIVQLKSSLAELRTILRQSGIGSLPLTFSGDSASSAVVRTISVDEATINVGAAYNRANQCRENAGIVQNVLEQELPTRRTL